VEVPLTPIPSRITPMLLFCNMAWYARHWRLKSCPWLNRPPVRPAPVFTLRDGAVIRAGGRCPGAKVIRPALSMDNFSAIGPAVGRTGN